MEASISHCRALKLLDDTVETMEKTGVGNARVFRDRVAELVYDHFSTVSFGRRMGPGYVYAPRVRIRDDQGFVGDTFLYIDAAEADGPRTNLFQFQMQGSGMGRTLGRIEESDVPLYEWMLFRDRRRLVRRYSPELAAYNIFDVDRKTQTPRDLDVEPDVAAYEQAQSMLTRDRPLADSDVFWDLGCGLGNMMARLRNYGFKGTLSGFDSSESIVVAAKNRGFDVSVCDITEDLPEGKFNRGVCLNVLQHYNGSELSTFFNKLRYRMDDEARFVIALKFGPEQNRNKTEAEIIGHIKQSERTYDNRSPHLILFDTVRDEGHTYLLIAKGGGNDPEPRRIADDFGFWD